MTHQQILSFAVIILMMGAFIWGRFRYDVVALCALLLAVAVGVVPYDQAFTGFSDDIVIIVGSALVVSAGVARSGLMQEAVQRFLPDINSLRLQLAVLVAIVTILSAFVKNVGALAIMIPVAFQFARRSNVSPSTFLMPMAFGALLGGLMTQVGTSPNIVVSRIRGELVGEPFTMFDFTPVGAVLAVVGLIYLTGFYWLVPQRSRGNVSLNEAIKIKNYASEARIPKGSPVVGKRVTDLIKPSEGEAMVMAIIRKKQRMTPLPDTVLAEGDVVLLEGDPKALDLVINSGKLTLNENRNPSDTSGSTDIEVVESVIGKNSRLIGLTAQKLELYARYDVNLLAVSRPGERITERPSEVTLRFGDVVVLQGRQAKLSTFLPEFELLPLARRKLMLGSVRRGLIPLAILIAAVIATAFSILPVAIAFFAAAVAMLLFRVIPLNEVYDEIDGPILVMLAALIPVSDALRVTGGTDLIAEGLAGIGTQLPPAGALALILIAAMIVTPFLNNAATVLVMAPIATSFATGLGFRPEAFLMAVAIGAGCDFLTPIGHQCNTLVMGPGGYKFADYPRLGFPLSVLIALVSVPTLIFFWPLQ
ncbi:SLC13 family permease [Falsochrobactrum shanghaiense]|uniref:SLC13 family permease n=1 Tax=Falsochrobactrum shanghaiense TaxID=2201899 RepID=A0A316JDA6_9HYPH|nr:SLC13 family permease [Falsochrobactrum shanghaiense]PWL18645.1 SLC13 family permease [Falsochrobactrum shanghaiense]